MTTRPVRVAVIDSGVNAAHPHIGGVCGGIAIAAGGPTAGETSADSYLDRIGHGTAVAAAIRERAPGADLLAVKVFHHQLSAPIDTLVAGIDWAITARADLINLSLGTANPQHAGVLQAVVARSAAAGALLVAAGAHAGVDYLPGSLPGVVRVELDWDCPRLAVRVASDTAGAAVCRAAGYPRPLPGVPPERNLKGISFAVANVTGALARELAAGSGPTCAQAVDLLRRAGPDAMGGSTARC